LPNDDFNLSDLFKDDPELQRIFDGIPSSTPPAPAPLQQSNAKPGRPPSLEDLQAQWNQTLHIPTPPPFVTQPPPSTPSNAGGGFTPFDFGAFFRQEPQASPEPVRLDTGQESAAQPPPGQQRYTPKPLEELTGFQPPNEPVDRRTQWDGYKQKRQKEAKPQTKTRKVIRAFSNILFWVTCITLVLGSIMFATSSDPRKAYFNTYRTYNVLTGSMTPRADGTSPPGGFNAGDVIIIKMCKPEDIKVGDIITFNPSANDESNTMYLTHRVVKILDELGGKPGIYFVTKGDANNSEDPPISGSVLIGKKVFHIPAVGGFLQKVRNNFPFAVATVICFFGFIFMLRWYFAKPKEAPEQTTPIRATT
jgi:signal peptidase I